MINHLCLKAMNSKVQHQTNANNDSFVEYKRYREEPRRIYEEESLTEYKRSNFAGPRQNKSDDNIRYSVHNQPSSSNNTHDSNRREAEAYKKIPITVLTDNYAKERSDREYKSSSDGENRRSILKKSSTSNTSSGHEYSRSSSVKFAEPERIIRHSPSDGRPHNYLMSSY